MGLIYGFVAWRVRAAIWVISIVTILITLLITTHEPPSGEASRVGGV